MDIGANVVPKITGMIQGAPINSEQFEPLVKEYQLVDTLPNESTVKLLNCGIVHWKLLLR